MVLIAWHYLGAGDLLKAASFLIQAGKGAELAEKTGNPIGKAIAIMIKSSLCITEMNRKQAEEYSHKSYQTLEEAVAETTHSPIADFLKRMLEQQAAL